jgi:hypothetical protein
MTLIQILAFDPSARRSSRGLTKQLSSSPLSAKSWGDLAKLHPEFFRVLKGKEGQRESISLVARFVLKDVPATSGAESKTPPLSAEIVNNLLNLVIQLHDREIQRRDRWKTVLVPTIVAGFTIAGFFFGVYKFYKQRTEQAAAAQVQLKRDNENRERELTRRLWERRLEIYGEAASTASQVAAAKDEGIREKMFSTFLEIYNGKLPLVWDSETCIAAN